MMRELTYKSDWELLRMADEFSPGNGPHLNVLAELVRRGVAESPERRTAIEEMGPSLSQAERFMTLAFEAINHQVSGHTEEQETLGRIQTDLAFQVRKLRAVGQARHQRRAMSSW